MTDDIQYWIKVAQYTGASVSIGLGAIGAAIGEGHTAATANAAISRNPENAGDIFKNMLVGQAVAESAAIFSLVVAMVLIFSAAPLLKPITIWAFLGAGLCMGFGAIGSGIGAGFPGAAACEGMARQPEVGRRLTTAMLIGSAVAQTTSIYALVIALILIFFDFSNMPFAPTWAALLGAGLATGIAALGPAIGEGLVAASCCEGIARNPSSATEVTNLMLLGQAVTETTGIYGLLISFILLFKAFEPTDALAPAFALLSSGLCMGLGAIGPGIGEGFTAQSAVSWIARNGSSRAQLIRTMLVGQAVSESTGIYSFVIALILIFVI
jgi:F-type H+-transporting ATPase subunit c